MSSLVTPDESSVQRFISQRALDNPQFSTLIAVAVQKYAAQFSATVWVGREIAHEMFDYAYQIEDELRRAGAACSIILKTDKELPFGGKYPLTTTTGSFEYRYYRIDAIRDEDFVYFYALRDGGRTYRFRVSLTGTLASMLGSRKLLSEDVIVKVYLDEIKKRLEGQNLTEGDVHDIMLNPGDIGKFAPAA